MTDTVLKVVKTNHREEKKTVYSGTFRLRAHDKTVKAYDVELHHPETGEPIFQAIKNTGYGSREHPYILKWHPYMTDTHPGLERSFEHGSRHEDYNHFNSPAGINDRHWNAGHFGGRLYDAAARSGFKDTLPHTVTPMPTEEDPAAHKITFHDPDTGDAIVHKAPGYSGKITFSGDYLKKHGIHPDVVQTYKGKGAYGLAMAIHAEKGKSYDLIGDRAYKATTHTYTSGKGESPEEMSRAHEAIVRHGGVKDHGENFSLTRTSPTTFHASHPHYAGSDVFVHHTSMVVGNKLFHHQVTVGGYHGDSHPDKRNVPPDIPSGLA